MPIPTFSAGQYPTAAALNAAFASPFSVGIDAWTVFIPGLTQSVTVTKTSNCAYWKVGRLITARYNLSVTSSGTANNGIVIGLPPFTAAGPQGAMGTFWMNDFGTSYYNGICYLAGGTTMNLLNGGANTAVMGATGGGFVAALAASDVITATIQYESTT